MSDWIKIGVEFIKALPGQWKGSSDPNAPSEIVDTVAEEAPRADSIAVGDESQISITSEASPNQQEIERRREIVRQFFNDFWVSAEDKPRTFAERLNRAEGHINERLAARGEIWQLDAASRKQLGLPPPKTRLDWFLEDSGLELGMCFASDLSVTRPIKSWCLNHCAIPLA
jgi:hypothetical protein